MASTILLKRSNTAGNDAYTGQLGEITVDTQARKLRIHDGTQVGGYIVANMTDIQNVIDQIDGLTTADIQGLDTALNAIEGDIADLQTDKADKTTAVSAGNGLSGGGDLSSNRTITLGTPDTVSGSSTNSVSATGHTHTININKNDVGLDQLDNTSDLDKPVSTAQQTALDAKIDDTEKGAANGVVPLDDNAKIDTVYLSDAVLGQVQYEGTWNAATNTPTLPTTPAQKGTYYVVDTAGTFETIEFNIGDWIISNGVEWQKVDNTDSVTSVAGRTGNVTLTSSDVGLGNVDNTSDLNKPISNDTQDALDLKAPLDSPSFTGTPTAPTPVTSDVSAKLATTQYVTDKIGEFSTGVTSVSTTAPIVDTGTSSNPTIGIDNATTSTDGAMSSGDKSKIDGIEAGAEVNTVDSVNNKTGAVTITKADVSLDSVSNYSTASQAEATTGTATNRFMTPQGVRYFVEDGTYTIDGGTF